MQTHAVKWLPVTTPKILIGTAENRRFTYTNPTATVNLSELAIRCKLTKNFEQLIFEHYLRIKVNPHWSTRLLL